MGSTGEHDRKRRHISSISSPTAAAAKKQPFLPLSEDKKVRPLVAVGFGFVFEQMLWLGALVFFVVVFLRNYSDNSCSMNMIEVFKLPI